MSVPALDYVVTCRGPVAPALRGKLRLGDWGCGMCSRNGGGPCARLPRGLQTLLLRPLWEGILWLASQQGGHSSPGAPGPALCPGRPLTCLQVHTLRAVSWLQMRGNQATL